MITERPVACIEAKPTKQSIEFAGVFISLSAISRSQNIDQSYLSRIFNGDRVPTLCHIRKISSALGMSIQAFIDSLDNRVSNIEMSRKALIRQHNERAMREDQEDLKAFRNGQIPLRRLPGLRASTT
jgi:transcriptional regulator with XRE-family HTH domain